MWRSGIFLLLLLSLQALPAEARTEAGGSRYCFGLIWCSEEKDGAVSRDGFLYLYSSEQRGEFSRLAIRPFYSEEIDPKSNHLRRSVLWPLGTYEQKGEEVWSHFFPLYWRDARPHERFTLILPLYFDYLKEENSYFHLFPLYGHHARGEFYDRYFVLGPLFIYTSDQEKALRQWDLLYPLISRRSDRESEATRVFPLYFSGSDPAAGRAYRFLLPIYGAWESPALSHRFLFPLYGSEEDKKTEEQRLSLLGLPPIRALRPLPTLALYEHGSTPSQVTDRLFPIYRYARWFGEDRTEIDALLIYRHESSPQGVVDRLFPFYRYEEKETDQITRLSLVGYQDLSLFWYQQTPRQMERHLFPLYSEERDLQSKRARFALLGYGPLSLYQHERTPLQLSDRFFPLYSFRETEEAVDLSLAGVGPLAFYRHYQDLNTTEDRLFPLYDYESTGDHQALSLLGLSELALYRQEITPEQRRYRLFPLYAYQRRPGKGEVDLNALLLYRHQSGPSLISDRLFPIYGYRSEGEQGYRLSLLGFPPTGADTTLSLYAHDASPSRVEDRFFPFYRYQHDLLTGERQWDALLVYQHHQTENFTKDALLPLYSYEHDSAEKTQRWGLLGVPPFMLFSDQRTPDESSGHLFPIYGYRGRSDEQRLTLLGFPPLGGAALSLYEHRRTEGEVVDRFFPVYRYVRRPKEEETEFNLLLAYHHYSSPQKTEDILFPLGNLTREGTKTEFSVIGYGPLSLFEYIDTDKELTHRLFPLYYYSGSHTGDQTFFNALLLYTHHVTAQRLYDGIFPLYGYDREEGKTAFSMLGFSELSVYRHLSLADRRRDRLFPLYSFEQEKKEGSWSIGMIGISPLSLYAHESKPASVEDRFFPLYRYQQDRERGEWRLTALGLDPILPLHLFSQEKTQAFSGGWLFPLYDYERGEDQFALSLVGLLGVSLYQHERTAERTHDRFFPLYDDQHEASGGRSFGLLGISPLTLYAHQSTPQIMKDHLFPLYGFHEEQRGETWRLSALGLPPIGSAPAAALYEHTHSDKAITDRFFPLYHYRYNLEQDERSFTTLLARYRENRDGKWQHLFPLYSYERDNKNEIRRVGVIGYAPFSLYQHLRTEGEISDRFFPLYRYTYNRTRGEGELSLLWPLVTYKRKDGQTTEASLFWWLMNYEQPNEETKQWHLLGGSAMAVVSRTVSPERSTFEFNPILPFYSYEKEKGKGAEWALFGGLIGVERSEQGERKMKWLWFFGGADDRSNKEVEEETL